jgi:hypothetical protein
MTISNPSQDFLLFTDNPFSKHNKNKTHQQSNNNHYHSVKFIWVFWVQHCSFHAITLEPIPKIDRNIAYYPFIKLWRLSIINTNIPSQRLQISYGMKLFQFYQRKNLIMLLVVRLFPTEK